MSAGMRPTSRLSGVAFSGIHCGPLDSLDHEEVKAKWGFWRNKFPTVWQVSCSSDWSWISKRLWTSASPTAFPEEPSRVHALPVIEITLLLLFQYYPLPSYNFHVLYSHLSKYFESITLLKKKKNKKHAAFWGRFLNLWETDANL